MTGTHRDSRATRVALFGAAPDTPNMGVSALFMSAVTGIHRFINPVEFVIFDFGLGRRDEVLKTPDGVDIPLIRYGARGGRRYYRPENLYTMLCASRLGPLGARLNAGVNLIDSCAAVLDVSGGDSFSDIYGRVRFDLTYVRKVLPVQRGRPLILLPQTYGPYKALRAQHLAASAVGNATMAWARDPNSYQMLKDLVGERFDPEIHRCGVDMAFGLLASPASSKVGEKINGWLASKGVASPLVGFNVSGLIYNDVAGAVSRYGFKADYRAAVVGFLRKILEETSARVVLIPHVMDPPGHHESDLAACRDVAGLLGGPHGHRVAVAPANLDQSEVKWLIARMDWFCGTRMHATIAALSSGVPTASISYSDKTLGVFATCGQAAQVFDPRVMDTEAVIAGLLQSFIERDQGRQSLVAHLPAVLDLASAQMSAIAARIQGAARQERSWQG